MRALYEIDQAIMDCVDLETGEILDSEALTALTGVWPAGNGSAGRSPDGSTTAIS